MNDILEEFVRTSMAILFNAIEHKHKTEIKYNQNLRHHSYFLFVVNDVLEEFVRVIPAVTLSVNKQLKPTIPQLCLIHHNDILEELIRVSLAVIINVNKYEHKLQKLALARNENETKILI